MERLMKIEFFTLKSQDEKEITIMSVMKFFPANKRAADSFLKLWTLVTAANICCLLKLKATYNLYYIYQNVLQDRKCIYFQTAYTDADQFSSITILPHRYTLHIDSLYQSILWLESSSDLEVKSVINQVPRVCNITYRLVNSFFGIYADQVYL